MGGEDKGWVKWQGKALVEHMHPILRPLTDDLIISCNRTPPRYGRLADQIVCDPNPDFPGPLIGIIEALKVAKHPHMLVLPCDAPLIDIDLIEQLTFLPDEHPVLCQQDGFWQPLFSLIPKSALPALEALWQAGERSPARALQSLKPRAIYCDSHDPRLANFNDPSYLKEALC